MEVVSWVAYILALILHWFKRWLVVREYTRRPIQFLVPGPSGVLIFASWILFTTAVVLFALVYSLVVVTVLTLATGIVLHLTTRFYFFREVDHWTEYYLEIAHKIHAGELESFRGLELPSFRLQSTSDETLREEAKEFATQLVLRIRESPIGKPDENTV